MSRPRVNDQTSPTKILFIGIDAGDQDLIFQWSKEGLLPTFRSLLEKGAWGITTNPVGFYVGAVWPSFFTGNSPARHGRYCYEQLRTGTYDHYDFLPFDIKLEPFWNTLSRANQRVAIIDVPKTCPSIDLNGIQIVDWGTHDRDIEFCTWPEDLSVDVLARFGKHPIYRCNANRTSSAEFKDLRDALVLGVEKRCELARHFLDQGAWDLFMTVFAESHCVGHQCWHIHDPTHPRHDAEMARSVGDPIKDVYIAIDAAIGQLLAQAGPETTVFILASHGMGPHYDGTFLLDEILCRLEESKLSRARRQFAGALERGWNKIPDGPRKRLGPLWNRAIRTLGMAVSEPEMSSRQCFPIGNNDVYGAIRINLVGREPLGRIKPGPEYDALCEKLRGDLLTLVNLDNGRPLVRKVFKTTDFYPGRNDELPDLLVEWDREDPISRVYSPKTGKIQKVFEGLRSGDHKPEGLFFALGPSIKRGRLERTVSVMDFAPTLASLLGVPLPHVEGESFAALIGSNHNFSELQ